MSISNDLIKQFVQITKDQSPVKQASTVYGTVVEYEGKSYVQIDGSELLTPVETSAEMASGERVAVTIKDHSAVVTGNLTNPSAGSNTVANIKGDLNNIGSQIAEFEIVIADKVSTKDFEANNATINNLIAGKASIKDLDVVNANIKNLQAEDAKINNLVAEKADIKDLTVANGKIENLEATKATIEDLKAASADIKDLTADIAKISTLIGGTASIDEVHSIILTSANTTIDNAVIKNAMIESITADKIAAGSINTNKVNIQSEDGGIVIAKSTQQFKDQNGKVRVQIGKDATGNFTFCLFSQDGVGILLDETGIKAGAVPDGLVVNDMVADNANISGGKLDISSVVTAINGNSTTIKSSIIKFDDTGQSLTVAFNTLKDSVASIEDLVIDGDLAGIMEQVKTNTTSIGVMQGSINTLINNTTITKDNGEVVQLKDDYSMTKQTVNQLTTKIGTLETNFNNGIKEVTDKQTELKANLDGFKTTVSSTYATIVDTDDAIRNAENALNNNIASTTDKVKNDTLTEADNKYANKSDYEEFKKVTSSSIEQTNNAVNIKFQNTTSQITNMSGELNEFKSSVTTNINFTENGIDIGKSNSQFSVNISNDKMSFKDDGEEVAYVSNKEMLITDANIESSLRLGAFKFIPRTNGNTSLIWDDRGNMLNYWECYPNATNANYPTTTAHFSVKPKSGTVYTIELSGILAPSAAQWGIYNSGGYVCPTHLGKWEYRKGVWKKSFVWKDITADGKHLGNNQWIEIYPLGRTDPSQNSTINWVKIYYGDDYWSDKNNLFRYNNNTTSGFAYSVWAGSNYAEEHISTYGYLETGKKYKFTCNVDCDNWGKDASMDKVYVSLRKRNVHEVNIDTNKVEILQNGAEFTVAEGGRYWVSLIVCKQGMTHNFSNIRVEEVR